MRQLKKNDAYKTETNTILWIDENDIRDGFGVDCELKVTQWVKRGRFNFVKTVVPLKENTEAKLEDLYSRKDDRRSEGKLTYLGNFKDLDKAMEYIV